MTTIHCLYRLANRPAAAAKEKLRLATKEACLRNFLHSFAGHEILVLGDQLDESTVSMIHNLGLPLSRVNEGSGAGNFRRALSKALELPDEALVYLVEDDFLHRDQAPEVLCDGLAKGFPYVTLYDHPGHYMDGVNPHVRQGGERTRLLLGKKCHWKVSNSTVMTFAATAGQLRRDCKTLLRFCRGRYTDDYRMFQALSWRGRKLISAVPGYATHCESGWLSPHYDWNSLLRPAAQSGEMADASHCEYSPLK